ncbi:hypothetical protein SDC9_194984 [bioreactor metagenome]|uniref:Uncharacterized protein n=1 Tax=bioreactor metagenome TaxID=1076179 RepID=A0A645I999_9ZZZZ
MTTIILFQIVGQPAIGKVNVRPCRQGGQRRKAAVDPVSVGPGKSIFLPYRLQPDNIVCLPVKKGCLICPYFPDLAAQGIHG